MLELDELYRNYAGRPSLLYYAEKMTKDLGGAKIYLKREDLNHTGAHKINNALGQAAAGQKDGQDPAHRRDRRRASTAWPPPQWPPIWAWSARSTWASQDMERQALNVYRMRLMGAKVHARGRGHRNAKGRGQRVLPGVDQPHQRHALPAGLRAWGPIPSLPSSGTFRRSSPRRSRQQMLAQEGKLPDAVIACVGGGSNAIGAFYNFIEDPERSADRLRGRRPGRGYALRPRPRWPPVGWASSTV